ncbi:MAG: PEP-CTERM sorting domain-containing protein [Candidatus Omnitrophica bacterium]|nr:PEP-CTERM sorting domain-containing protein [Candidatus Omnitrophota bacterium]
MKKIVILQFFTIIFLLAITQNAHALVITFDDLQMNSPGDPSDEPFGFFDTYTYGGFIFTSEKYDGSPGQLSFPYQDNPNGYYYGSASLLNRHDGGITRLSTVSGDMFTLEAMDLHRHFQLETYTALVDFYAYDETDTQVGNQSYLLEDGEWHNIVFGEDFQDIAYVRWEQSPYYHQFDNVTVSLMQSDEGSGPETSTPEPASLFFFGTGLIGFALSRRRS